MPVARGRYPVAGSTRLGSVAAPTGIFDPMDTLLQDVRHALRRLARSPGFATIAVLTLALGIGANSAIFSVVNGVLLRSLPYPDQDRLVRIFTYKPETGARSTMSPPDFTTIREQTQAFTDVVAYTGGGADLTGVGDPERLEAFWVSAGFFEVLGVSPILGRTFHPEENQLGNNRLVILGHAAWQQRFGSDPDVVGRTVTLNGIERTVVGVMPPGLPYPADRELWMPLVHDEDFDATTASNRRAQWLDVLARVRPGVPVERAHAELSTLAARLQQEFPQTNTNISFSAVPLSEVMVGQVRTPLLVLLGAVGLVLLIACANVASLLLARAAAREGEFAVRTALGASRGRLARQLLVESTVLGALGGAFGLLFALFGIDLLLALRPADLPRLDAVRLDGSVLAFTAVIALLTAVLFGLFPALQASRPDLVASLKESGRGGLAGRKSRRLRSALVVFELALSVMLLTGAGLLIRSFFQLQQIDTGFRSEGVVAFELSLPSARYEDEPQSEQFYSELLERLRAVPGVSAAGAASALPLSGGHIVITFQVEGREPAPPGEAPAMQIRIATPDYFRALGIPMLRGRPLAETDHADAPPVMLINDAAVREFFRDEEPLGQRIDLGWVRDSVQIGGEVVGVVGNIRELGLVDEFAPTIYLPHRQVSMSGMEVVVRTAGDPLALAGVVRREVQAIDPNLPISNLRTLDQLVSQSVAQPRFYMLLLTLFALVALTLATVGVFGVMTYTVVQRTREIGIRMALGADAGSVRRLVVGRALFLAAFGVGLGVLGSLALSRVLQSLLYGVSTTDPLTLATVAAVLAAVALLASYLPARTATRVDPLTALRAE